MFITKISLPRRTFLRGMGASVALPFLEAMVPALTATARTAATPPLRFGAVFIPNGAITDRWIPETAGADFTFPPILKPLERVHKSVVVVSNLTRATPGVVEGDHAISASGWLTGVYPKRTEAEDIHAGTTIDQIVAKQIGQDTPFPSLELATTDFTGYIGACTSGFSCAYTNTISWSSPTTPLPMEINPRVVFERMFGRPGTEAERRARMPRNRSILDLITRDDRPRAQSADLSADRRHRAAPHRVAPWERPGEHREERQDQRPMARRRSIWRCGPTISKRCGDSSAAARPRTSPPATA
jgi:hypothetical protein